MNKNSKVGTLIVEKRRKNSTHKAYILIISCKNGTYKTLEMYSNDLKTWSYESYEEIFFSNKYYSYKIYNNSNGLNKT